MTASSVNLHSRTTSASASSTASQHILSPAYLEALQNLEKTIQFAVKNGEFQTGEVGQLVPISLIAVRTVQSARFSPRELRDTIRRVNDASYQYLRKKGKISCCSWSRFFGPSYFEQLHAILAADLAREARIASGVWRPLLCF